MLKLMGSFLRDEAGATAIEYGLIAGLISVILITALSTLGTNLSNKFNNIADALN